MKDVAIVSKGWPAMNPTAFWSLTERVDNLFTLETSDQKSATYVFQNTENGEILCAPFQAMYNLNIDWPKEQQVKATLFYNNTALETCEGSEIDFDTFSQSEPFPLCLMSETDELRIVISFQKHLFLPVNIGSARMLRFTKKEQIDPFCICTTDTCAIMFDGKKIQAMSTLNNTESDSDDDCSQEYNDIVQAIMNSEMPPQDINELLHSMENPIELKKLKSVLRVTNS
jgi:hypothetical protein